MTGDPVLGSRIVSNSGLRVTRFAVLAGKSMPEDGVRRSERPMSNSRMRQMKDSKIFV